MANQRRARYSVADVLRQILEDESDIESLSDPSDDDSYIPDQAAVRDTSDEDQVSDVDEQPDEISADSGHSYNQSDNENAQQGQAIAERPRGRGRARGRAVGRGHAPGHAEGRIVQPAAPTDNHLTGKNGKVSVPCCLANWHLSLIGLRKFD